MADPIPSSDTWVIRYAAREGGWVEARVDGRPEVITAASTFEGARRLVLDALIEALAAEGGKDTP